MSKTSKIELSINSDESFTGRNIMLWCLEYRNYMREMSKQLRYRYIRERFNVIFNAYYYIKYRTPEEAIELHGDLKTAGYLLVRDTSKIIHKDTNLHEMANTHYSYSGEVIKKIIEENRQTDDSYRALYNWHRRKRVPNIEDEVYYYVTEFKAQHYYKEISTKTRYKLTIDKQFTNAIYSQRSARIKKKNNKKIITQEWEDTLNKENQCQL